MPSNREILSVAVKARADRIYHEAVETERVLVLRIEEALTGVDVIALLVEVSEGVKRGNKAAGVVQAVGACQAAVPEAEDSAVVVAAAEAAVVVAAVVAGSGA